MSDPRHATTVRIAVHVATALALGLVAFATYIGTMSSGPAFGQFDTSASLIVQHTGLSPLATPFNPVWGAAARMIAGMPFGSASSMLNVFSGICGALCVLMTYWLAAWFVYHIVASVEENLRAAFNAAWLAGATSAMFLAFSLPFWTVSNRAHTATFDLLLLLVAMALLLGYLKSGRTWLILVFSLLSGIGTVEFATFMVFVPLFALVFVFAEMRTGQFRVKLLSLAAILYLAGLSLYFLVAWRFRVSEAFAFSGFQSFFEILRYTWSTQFQLITHSLPPTGWLIVLLMTAAPWIVMLLVAHRGLTGERQGGFYALHVVLTAIAVLIMFDLKCSPWRLLGMQRLLVTPYFLLAWVYGYLAAYWAMLPATCWKPATGALKPWIAHTATIVFGGIALAAVCVPPFLNKSEADARPGDVANVYAGHVLDSIGDRSWLITDGTLDSHLLIAAHDRQKKLTLIDLSSGKQLAYMNYVASLFDQPRLKNLAQVGITPLLQHWFTTDPDIEKKVALLANPDLWFAAHLTPVPFKTVFLGTRQPAALDVEKLFNDHVEFWKEAGPPMLALRRNTGFQVAFAADCLLRQMGLIANNLGVCMQDAGRTDHARAAFQKALEMDPSNVSATLNLATLSGKRLSTQEADAVSRQLKLLFGKQSVTQRILSLSQYYGYLYMPEAFADLGWAWALSGNRAMSVSDLTRAVDGGGKQALEAKSFLAEMYMEYEEQEKSEGLYRQILEKDPANRAALLAMARISAARKNVAAADEFLDRAAKAGVPARSIALERAVSRMLTGNTAEAKSILQTLVETDPSFTQAVLLLTDLAITERDDAAIERCEVIIEKEPARDFSLTLALAKLAEARRDLAGARRCYNEALAMRPATVPLLERLLQLDMNATDEAHARIHIRQILNIDPNNAPANYLLGTLQVANREYALAEDSFRTSLSRQETPHAFNDLAWTLLCLNREREALTCALKSLNLDGNAPASWDTLGVILTRMGSFDKAEEAFAKSMVLSPVTNVETVAHTAELYEKTGREAKALDVANSLLSRGTGLSKDSKKMLTAMRDRLAGKVGK